MREPVRRIILTSNWYPARDVTGKTLRKSVITTKARRHEEKRFRFLNTTSVHLSSWLAIKFWYLDGFE